MKWISVKEHKPAHNSQCFMRLSDGTLRLGYFDDMGFLVFGETYGYDATYMGNVTHFCVPDPIEAEND